MPPVAQLDTPPASPNSPPRKRRKFSLRLKGKTSKTYSETDSNNTSKSKAETNTSNFETTKSRFYPLFSKISTPPRTQKFEDEEDCDTFTPTKSLDRPPPPYSGVKNLGNTCYANAVLQVLRHCSGFVDSVNALADDLKKQQEEKNLKAPDTEETIAGAESIEQCSSEASGYFTIVNKLDELMWEMEHLENDYQVNGEKCEWLKPRRDGMVLAAEPVDFMNVFRNVNSSFCSFEQHDAQEFLRTLLINIQDAAKEVAKSLLAANAKVPNKKPQVSPKKEIQKAPKSSIKHYFAKESCAAENPTNSGSFIEKIFQGRLVSQTKCLTCEEAKKRHEDFQDISVPIQKESLGTNAKKHFSPFSSEKERKHNLDWAISQFASVEFLNGDNKYFCDSCKTHTEAEIRTCFDVLPEVLTIHLKRFTTTVTGSMSGWVSKINSNLDTPETLVLDPWCSPSVKSKDNSYELFGIVMHSGMTSCSGHYQAYVKVPFNGYIANNNVDAFLSESCPVQEKLTTKDLRNGNGTSIENDETNMQAKTGKRGESAKCGTNTVSYQHKNNATYIASDQELNDYSDVKDTGKVTCLTGIAKFLQTSKKSTKRRCTSVDSVIVKQDSAENETDALNEAKMKSKSNCSKFENNRNETSDHNQLSANGQSSKRVQNGHGELTKKKSTHVRKLEFQHKNCSVDSQSQHENKFLNEENKENVPSERSQMTVDGHAKEDISKCKSDVLLDKESQSVCDKGSKWVQFDDAIVHILERSEVARVLSSSESAFTSPYLLFYKRSVEKSSSSSDISPSRTIFYRIKNS